jgi:alginate O-acetyltransferase complex protein AlgJ
LAYIAGLNKRRPKIVVSVTPVPDMNEHGRSHLHAVQNRRGLTVVGWAAGRDLEVSDVRIYSRGELIAQAPVQMDRPDVAEVHGQLMGAAKSGFRLILEPETFGTSTLVVRALLADQREVLVGTLEVKATPSWRSRLSPSNLMRPSKKDAEIEWTVLSPPEEREKVLLGKEGWLFLRRDSNDVIGQQTGKVALGRRRRRQWKHLLRERIALVESLGAAWQCLVIPDKEFLYSEYLPDDLSPARRRPVHEILDLASSEGAPISYALPDLETVKAEAQLFSKTDTHWNQRGSYVAYRSLCHALGQQGAEVPVLSEEAITWSQANAPGGLGMKLYPELTSSTVRADLAEHRGRLIFDNRIHNHGRVMVFEQDRRDGRSAVIFGESFVQNMLLYLKESFRRLVFVHTSTMAAGVLEHERPDVVLSVPLERFLIKVPDDTNALRRLCDEAKRKLALDRLSPLREPFLRNIPRAGMQTERVGVFAWPAPA